MNWQEYKGRIVFTILGIILAISFLTIGFWKTIFWLLFALIGYLFGSIIDKKVNFYEFLEKIKEIFNIGRE
ncbi:MAG: hypothetical protein CBR30_07910 [Dictyoglomus sp. NZ13-RE01]|nr:MAG: hypothetical protein CBR30_07910 [Dictyoglomus sp. NZ13-RE01]